MTDMIVHDNRRMCAHTCVCTVLHTVHACMCVCVCVCVCARACAFKYTHVWEGGAEEVRRCSVKYRRPCIWLLEGESFYIPSVLDRQLSTDYLSFFFFRPHPSARAFESQARARRFFTPTRSFATAPRASRIHVYSSIRTHI